ncbi:MAG: UDP-glucose 6-dehydrogenase, partial [Spirochaetales bacterium]|nr:UDP-glucose 6-dehydrogenase [Spirochaetales bacterium]
MNITVVGTGYVGLSLSILLSQHNKVIACDVVQAKVDLINNKKSPISDKEIEEYLSKKDLDLTATCDPSVAYKNPDYVVIATPTNYDAEKNYFDTSSIESVLSIVMKQCPEAVVVIKSTIPV